MMTRLFGINQLRHAFRLILFCIVTMCLAGCSPSNTAVPPSQPPVESSNTAHYPVAITNFDAAEHQVAYTYYKAPAKVVVTHPGATELLLELGLKDHIQATVRPYGAPLDRLADKYAKLNIMNAVFIPSLEELLEMQPDMIIAWAHHFDDSKLRDVANWHGRGVATFVMPSSLTKLKPNLDNALYACISDIGKIFNIEDKTASYIKKAKERVAFIENVVKDIPQRKTVLILQDYANGTFSMYDSKYLIHNMVEIAGGTNLCEDPAAWVGAEKVLAFDPDVIIFVSTNKHDSTKDLTDDEAAEQVKGIAELQSMRAIRQGNIINIPFFTVNNGGVRTIDTIEKIARRLYPERFK